MRSACRGLTHLDEWGLNMFGHSKKEKKMIQDKEKGTGTSKRVWSLSEYEVCSTQQQYNKKGKNQTRKMTKRRAPARGSGANIPRNSVLAKGKEQTRKMTKRRAPGVGPGAYIPRNSVLAKGKNRQEK